MLKNNKAFAVILAGTLIAGCQTGPAFAYGNNPLLDTLSETATERAVVTDNLEEQDIETPKESDETVSHTAASRLLNDGFATIQTKDVEPGADDFTAKVTYQTYDPDEDAGKHLPENIDANGEGYHLLEFKTPLLVSKEDVVPKTIAYESEVFNGNEAEHEPEEQIVYEDGLTYHLKSKTLNEQTTQERSEYKETVVSYKGVEAGVQIQDKKEVEIQDADTGQTVKAPLDLLSQKTVKEYWDNTFQFEITITGYDADILVLNNKEIPKDADLMNYTDDLLAIINLDPAAYKIEKIDLQPIEGNSDVRKATAYGSKYVKNIDATYGGTVTLPAISGKSWDCVYEEEIPENQKVIYTMSTTVSYERGNGTAQTKGLLERISDAVIGFITAAYEAAAAAFEEHPVITSIPVILAAAFIALLITKKIRNRCIYDGSIKCIYKKHNKTICKSCPNYRQRNSV